MRSRHSQNTGIIFQSLKRFYDTGQRDTFRQPDSPWSLQVFLRRNRASSRPGMLGFRKIGGDEE